MSSVQSVSLDAASPVPFLRNKEGFCVLLDGRGIATPWGSLLCVPSETLAYGVAAEFAAQEERIKPALMPLVTLCSTAIDIVPRTRDKTLNDIVKFLATDTVCFFADEAQEPALREVQEELFNPIIDWFEKAFDVKLETNRSSMANSRKEGSQLSIVTVQPDWVRERVKRRLAELDEWELSALDRASGEAKSTAISAMLCAGALSSRSALDAAKAEELYQRSRWGDVPASHGVDFGLSRLLLSACSFYSKAIKE